MQITDKFLKFVLTKGSYISQEDLDKAERESNQRQVSLELYLLNEGVITRQLIGQAVAEALNVPYIDLKTEHTQRRQEWKIDEEMLVRSRIIPVRELEDKMLFTTDLPESINLQNDLSREYPGKNVVIGFSNEDDVSKIISSIRKPLQERITPYLKIDDPNAPDLFKLVVDDALDRKASDVHIEPMRGDVLIRFREDGVLRVVARIPSDKGATLVNVIKVLAKLKTDNHFSPQDGSLEFQSGKNYVDMRVSVVPTIHGEKVVMRVLSAYVRSLSLNDLGLSPRNIKLIDDASKKPFGMIILVGPTGSGKTTTLYGLLYKMNSEQINIATIEDPVEYRLPGVNHIQVNNRVGLTFLTGLKSIVRQDPDVILLGEIRDQETADVAVNAALTGHLMLSTFHANNAATAVPRLIDMGVEPFLLSSALEVVAAQRLVRQLCNNCRLSRHIPKYEFDQQYPNLGRFVQEENVTLYESKGCEVCNQTGFEGRTAVYEMIAMTPQMKDLILRSPSTDEIFKLAREQGMQTMFEDGIEKAKRGITTIEEVLRVTDIPDV